MSEQRSLKWVRGASTDEIDAALHAGELSELLAGRDPGEQKSDQPDPMKLPNLNRL